MVRLAPLLSLLLLLLALGAHSAPTAPPRARLEPDNGFYFGTHLDWSVDNPAAYEARLGLTPAVYGIFLRFPFTAQDQEALGYFMPQIQARGAAALLTLEPFDGLATITPEVAEALALQLAAYNAQGVPVFVRFAHEMNGSWYPWGQQPGAYRAAFTLLAEAIHARAPQSALLWAPSYGAGYPFAGGAYEAQPGSAAHAALDTNGDGRLTMEDDMYAPYYPGDEQVDWVGLSLYHWDNEYPWDRNEVPEAGKFGAQLRGTYQGLNGDERVLPDFYADYGEARGKPLAIGESAAMFLPGQAGDEEGAVKAGWWEQLFDPSFLAAQPQLKMVLWFEVRKQEDGLNQIVDWRATHTPALASALRARLQSLPLQGVPRPRLYLPLLSSAAGRSSAPLP